MTKDQSVAQSVVKNLIGLKGGENMDFNAIIQAIGSVGFPIVCCVYLIYTQKEVAKTNAEQLEEMRKTVDNNTKVMYQICGKLDIDLEKGVENE